MSTLTPSAEVHDAVQRTIERIRAWGIDGPRPIEEIEALLQHGDAVGPALGAAVEAAEADALAAAIHLVSLLRLSAALEAVQRAAFEHPASLEAKRQALEAVQACDGEVDGAAVEQLERAEAFVESADGESLDDVLTWPAAWRMPTIAGWLRRAGPSDIALVERLLGTQPDLDVGLLDWLGDQAVPDAAEIVQQYIDEASDREKVKAAKRVLHRLRTRGVEIDEPVKPEQGQRFSLAIKPNAVGKMEAHVSSIDGRGARLIWILLPSASGGHRMLQALVDDVRGLVEAELMAVSRRGFRSFLDKHRARPALLVSQSDADTAGRLLAAAAAMNRSSGAEMPAAYSEWRETAASAGLEISDATEPLPARIYENIAADAVRDRRDLRDASIELLREPAFASWAAEGEAVDRAADEVRAAEQSSLMIDEDQRRERMQDAIRSAVHETFDDALRQRYRRRLEAMAELLWANEQREAAEQALAAAVGFTEEHDLFDHPFARALVHRGVWLAYQVRRRDDAASGTGLIRP